jgi:hypothetical protein
MTQTWLCAKDGLACGFGPTGEHRRNIKLSPDEQYRTNLETWWHQPCLPCHGCSGWPCPAQARGRPRCISRCPPRGDDMRTVHTGSNLMVTCRDHSSTLHCGRNRSRCARGRWQLGWRRPRIGQTRWFTARKGARRGRPHPHSSGWWAKADVLSSAAVTRPRRQRGTRQGRQGLVASFSPHAGCSSRLLCFAVAGHRLVGRRERELENWVGWDARRGGVAVCSCGAIPCTFPLATASNRHRSARFPGTSETSENDLSIHWRGSKLWSLQLLEDEIH